MMILQTRATLNKLTYFTTRPQPGSWVPSQRNITHFCDVAYMSAVCRRVCSVPPPLGCLPRSSSVLAGLATSTRCLSAEGAWLRLL